MNILNRLINSVVKKRDFLLNTKKINYKLIHKDYPTSRNIIFLSPALNYPSGGGIVSHSHSETINSINYKTVKSCVLYPYKLNFKTSWFDTGAQFKRDLNLDPKSEFIVIPEIFAVRHAQSLIALGVSYAINVQNGYLIDFESSQFGASYNDIKEVYEKADFIIGISDDAVANIKLTFPNCASRIIKSYYIIDKAQFKPFHLKKNIISYMPRKLARHTELFIFMVKQSLPPNWMIEVLDNLPEKVVYEKLSDTKIFLSFSELEGLAMPPVMAALSGAHVIGYTGEGCKEYFHYSCFTEISSGDIKNFITELLECIRKMESGTYVVEEAELTELSERFSQNTQKNYIKELTTKINDILDAKSLLTQVVA